MAVLYKKPLNEYAEGVRRSQLASGSIEKQSQEAAELVRKCQDSQESSESYKTKLPDMIALFKERWPGRGQAEEVPALQGGAGQAAVQGVNLQNQAQCGRGAQADCYLNL